MLKISVVQDIGRKSNTSIFITFIIMQLVVEQKLTIPNPFIHRSISSYSETHFYSVTDRKKRKRKDMTDMPSTWFLLLNNRHERAFSFLEGMMNEFYHILIRKADIIPTKSILCISTNIWSNETCLAFLKPGRWKLFPLACYAKLYQNV